MIRVDFYLLPSAEPQARLLFACRLADKAWRQGMTVFVRCADEEQCRQLDEMMWRFNPHVFLPHDILAAPPLDTPIQLALTEVPDNRFSFLINLRPGIPGNADIVQRIAELVIEKPEIRDTARENFRYYRDQGYALQHHRLTRL